MRIAPFAVGAGFHYALVRWTRKPSGEPSQRFEGRVRGGDRLFAQRNQRGNGTTRLRETNPCRVFGDRQSAASPRRERLPAAPVPAARLLPTPQSPVDAVHVEALRVPHAADPGQVLLVLVMLRIGKRVEEIGVPRGASDIL